MKSNTIKRIATLTFLTMFLFGLLVPLSQSFAAQEVLKLSADPASIKPGETTKITATLTGVTDSRILNENLVVIFSSTSSGKYTVSNSSVCDLDNVTKGEQSCSVVFTISTGGQFHINAILGFKKDYNNYLQKKLTDKSALFLDGITGDLGSIDVNVAVPVQPLKCDPPQKLNADKTACVTDTDTTYTPLAPLPGLGLDEKGQPTDRPIDTKQKCAFGNYLNIIIKLVLGIAGVLAMVMIVMGGIEYMTSDLISSKEAGKEQITHAVLGLLLALGAYLILNTINPQLLSACLDKLPQATITIMDETETVATAQTQDDSVTSGSVTGGCKEGIIATPTTNGGTFYLCKTISSKVQAMVNTAWQKGYKLTGGAFRSKQRQETLRSNNCGGSSNIYNVNAKCNPLTAIPGTSRHENGLAIDFKCDGVLIQNNTNACFIWLKANAGSYGLQNLKQEQWHWSIDGR